MIPAREALDIIVSIATTPETATILEGVVDQHPTAAELAESDRIYADMMRVHDALFGPGLTRRDAA